MNWLKIPKKVYFKKGSMNVALKELDEVYGLKRALIISDAKTYVDGIVRPVNDWVRSRGIRTAEFFTVDEVPTFANARSGLPKMLEFEPDVIIGVGGGSVMSIAKVMWMLYENPELDLDDAAKKFSSVTAEGFPEMGKKAKFVLVATTAGSGAECTPYAVLADDSGKKQCIASYSLLPEIAVIDSLFAEKMPADILKKSGLTVFTQAVRAYNAPGCTDYVKGFAKYAALRVIENLEDAMKGCPIAIDNIANAAAHAGIAYGASFETMDPEAVWFPTAAEKSAASDYDELAKAIGRANGAILVDDAERLASL